MKHAEHLQYLLNTIDTQIRDNIKAHGEVVFYIPDIDDLAEAYLEAFRELGHVVGIETDTGPMFFAVANPSTKWNGRISNEAIEFHNALLDAAEGEGWDIEEMEDL